MTFRDWVEFLVQIVLLAGAVTVPIAALGALRGDARWLTRREWKVAEENQAQRLAEVILKPLDDIAKRIAAMADIQNQTLRGQVRQEEINKSIGRSLDEIRDDVRDLRGRVRG
uniref:Uncharacterized protein n=1 Tax=viral metagenome TaxID=1070528 RepID=A0A6M3K128_9ZZZZ